MIKKASIFFTTPVRNLLDFDEGFRISSGFLNAIQLPNEVIIICQYGFVNRDKYKCPTIYEAIWNLNTGFLSRNNSIRAFNFAARMETTINLDNETVNAEIKFFKKRKKENFYSFNVSFGIKGGEVVN